jgi:hypothetical protein
VNVRNNLRAKETDWNLAGVNGALTVLRTRHCGQGRPNLQRQEAYCSPVRVRNVVNLESSDSEYVQESSSSSQDDVEEQEDKKPPAL